MNALSYMIKYLPCLLVNFQGAIYKNPPLLKCSKPTTIYTSESWLFSRKFSYL